jgi:hypothetical protein
MHTVLLQYDIVCSRLPYVYLMQCAVNTNMCSLYSVLYSIVQQLFIIIQYNYVNRVNEIYIYLYLHLLLRPRRRSFRMFRLFRFRSPPPLPPLPLLLLFFSLSAL